MRPPEFTGGNPRRNEPNARIPLLCFNEAAGIHRRKRTVPRAQRSATTTRFNEAAGIHRRKHVAIFCAVVPCSMGFNEAAGIHRRKQAALDVLDDAGTAALQ